MHYDPQPYYPYFINQWNRPVPGNGSPYRSSYWTPYWTPNRPPYWSPYKGWSNRYAHVGTDGGYWRNDGNHPTEWKDYGGQPFVVNIEQAAERNPYFRTALWTGSHLQVTLMSIGVGEDIGLEMHADVDQFIRIEEGRGLVRMGPSKDRVELERTVTEDDAIMIPAGTWHNVINVGRVPLKLYSIYAPPEHPFGTIHKTKAEAEAAHRQAASST